MPDGTTTRGSRAARSSGLRLNTSQPRARSQGPIRREVPDATPAEEAEFQLATRFSSFFQPGLEQLQRNQQQRSLDTIRRENKELAVQARADALRPGAAEAARTGNLSSFTDDATASRRAYVETLKDTIARRAAIEDFSGAFSSSLNALDFDTGNPAVLQSAFLEENLKGADPFFADIYQQEFTDKADRAVFAWRKSRASFQAARVVKNTITTMQMDPPTSAEGVQQFLADVQNSALGADGKLAAHQDAMAALMREAVKTPAVLRALDQPDPGHPENLSLREQHPELWEKANADAISEYRAVRTLAAAEDLDNLDFALTQAEEGLGEASIQEVFGMIMDHKQRHGPSARMSDLRDRAIKSFQNNAEFSAVFDTFMNSDDFISDSDLNKHGMKLFSQAKQQLVAEGKQPFEVVGRLGQMLARRGFGDDFGDNLEHELNSSATARVQEAFVLLSAADAEAPGIAGRLGLSEEAQNTFAFLRAGQLFSDPDQGFAFGTSLEEYRNLPKEARDFEKWAPATFGTKLFNETVTEALEDLDEDEHTQAMQIAVRREVARSMARLSRTDNEDLGTIAENARAIAVEAIKNRASVIEVDGERLMDIDLSPRRIILPNGESFNSRPLNGDDIDFMEESFEALQESVGDALGDGFAGVRPDAFGTPWGRGYELLVFDAAGTPMPLVGTAGTAYPLDDEASVEALEALGADDPLTSLVTIGPDGRRMLNVPPILPDDGLPLNATGSLRVFPHPTNPGMFKVYATGDRTSIEQLTRDERDRMDEIIEEREETGPMLAFRQAVEREAQVLDQQTIARAARQFPPQLISGIGQPRDPGRRDPQAVGQAIQVPGVNPVPDAPPVARQPKAYEAEFQRLLDSLTDGGRAPAASRLGLSGAAPIDGAEMEIIITQLEDIIVQDGYQGDSLTTNFDDTMQEEVLANVRREEGFSSVAYEDGNDLSIGYGFFLGRKDAKPRLEAMGYDWQKIRSGEQGITKPDAEALMLQVIQQQNRRLDREFDKLDRHQRIALLDLAYNCPACVGPKLIKAIKEGDLEEAAREIAYRSNRGNNEVLAGRRVREAIQFLGSSMPLPEDTDLREIR